MVNLMLKSFKYLKHALILTGNLIILFLTNNYFVFSQTWEKIDSISPYVNTIYFPLNGSAKVIVASDEFLTNLDINPATFPIIGSGYRVSTDSGKTFSDKKLNGYSVYDFTQDPNKPDNYYASIRSMTLGGIALSKDGGSNWNDSVLKCQSTSQVMKLLYKGDAAFKFFGAVSNTRHGFVTFADTFKTCESNDVIDVQSRDIEISPKNTSLMFLAADGVYSKGVYRSYNNGSTWLKDEHGLESVNVLCVMPSPLDPAVVLCGSGSSEGGIYRSIDTGKTWQKLPFTNGKVYTIVKHPLNPKFMIAACGKDGIWASSSYGGGWEQMSSLGLPNGSDVRKAALPPWENTGKGYITFIAIDSGGLYRSQPLITSVSEGDIVQQGKNISVYPQPANDKVDIQFYNIEEGSVKIDVKDSYGRHICNIFEGFLDKGIQNIIWNIPHELAGNIYFAILQTSYGTDFTKILIVH
jgi:hypothetical protein